MSFPVLDQYKTQFPAHAELISEFQNLYNKKLWHELTQGILKFIYSNDVKGKLSFNFYTDFVKKFDRNIDQINHLKILKQCLTNVPAETAIGFLENFQQKDAFTDQTKAIAAGLRANYYVGKNPEKSSQLYRRLQKFVKQRKDADSFAFSTFYRFAYNYFLQKNKQKSFYENALQYLAYTPAEQMQQNAKIQLLSTMGIAILASPQIFNFSELLQQPLLKTLENSPYKWVYELLNIFNTGDINTFNSVIDDAASRNKQLLESRKNMDQKIRLMSFLELAFNLPKNNRIVSFEQLTKTCAVPIDHVEFMIMKAAALKLVKVQIDQINQQVLVTWIAPKVLGKERIQVMLNKFEEWETGVKDVENFIHQNWKIKA